MGKKKVTEQTTEKALKENEGVDKAVAKVASSAGGGSSSGGKKIKRLTDARIYVNASYNNTVITVADMAGNVVTWATAGAIGFSGPKKATPFAASKIIAVIAEKLKALGTVNVEVYLKGIGGGRDSAVRSLINHGFTITTLKDVTPIPHNGPRPRKVRRV